jgi:hypothetical protein
MGDSLVVEPSHAPGINRVARADKQDQPTRAGLVIVDAAA